MGDANDMTQKSSAIDQDREMSGSNEDPRTSARRSSQKKVQESPEASSQLINNVVQTNEGNDSRVAQHVVPSEAKKSECDNTEMSKRPSTSLTSSNSSSRRLPPRIQIISAKSPDSKSPNMISTDIRQNVSNPLTGRGDFNPLAASSNPLAMNSSSSPLAMNSTPHNGGPNPKEPLSGRSQASYQLSPAVRSPLSARAMLSLDKARSPSSHYRKEVQKRSRIKLKPKEQLEKEIEECKKKFNKFDNAYSHSLAYYFLSLFFRHRNLNGCFDFVNKVDIYRSLRNPTTKAAETALNSLRSVTLIDSLKSLNLKDIMVDDHQTADMKSEEEIEKKDPPNAIPWRACLRRLKKNPVDPKAFDDCYKRVRAVLESFYRAFLNSKQFVQFVQFMEYSNRRVTPKDLTTLTHLGEGAFGRVTAVVKKDTQAVYAMKEIPKDVLRKQKTGWMCLNEMQLLSRTKSPFVLNLKYSFHSNRAIHLIFEMCMGGDLKQYLEKGPFRIEVAKFYTAEILLGIDHIHSLEYAYRDLKPSNILLTHEGHCKISDLGLVVRLPKLPKVLKHVAGTPGYWAPEICSRSGTYACSDYWSMGVLLFTMLNGAKNRDPLSGKRPKQERDRKTFKYWSPFSGSAKEQYVAKNDKRMEFCDATIKWTDKIPEDAKDLISKFCVIDHLKRIGAQGGLQEISEHAFFKEINWDALIRMEVKPPFIPKKTKYFHKRVKSRNKSKDFKPLKDDEKEKEFYDEFMFANREGIYEEVVEALEDEEAMRKDKKCVIS
mmetsp:Transcript_16700/g.41130  ORF Transcript_16700/g.41130 Transcript_16700/m.41130 type:complete len:770 (-) Transcript_16700:112-2421(-)